MVKGIAVKEIQLHLLSDQNQEMSLEEVMRFVEAKEAGKRSANKLFQNNNDISSSKSQYRKSSSPNLFIK